MNKYWYFLIGLLVFANTSFAQSDDVESNDADSLDYTQIEIHFHKKPLKNSEVRFGLFDIGVSTYLSDDGGFNLPQELDYLEQNLFKSTNINIGLISHRLGFAGNHLGFEYGLTFNSMKYYFHNSWHLIGEQPTFHDSFVLADEEYEKNRLMTNYITLPLGFSYRSNPNSYIRSFYLSIGAYGGFLVGSNHKYKDSRGEKFKVKDDFSLNKFVAGLQGRIGVGPLNLYVQYSLTEMFQSNEGPKLNQLNFGISILPF